MDTQIKLDVSRIKALLDARIIRLKGDLDSTNAESVLDQVTKLMNEGYVRIIADFSSLRYVNSTGMGVLLHLQKTAKERNGCFKIARINENVREIIEIVGAGSILQIYDKVEDAVSSLS
ncbi:STAS domain-containing protein [Fibrobacterota bacterium]